MKKLAPRAHRPSFRADELGVATVEYVVLLVLVTLGMAAAVYTLGPTMLDTFRFTQTIVAMPFP